MSRRSPKEITPVVRSAPVVKNTDKAKPVGTQTTGIASERRDTENNLIVNAITLMWTVVAYKTQFADCLEVQNFMVMFSEGHHASI